MIQTCEGFITWRWERNIRHLAEEIVYNLNLVLWKDNIFVDKNSSGGIDGSYLLTFGFC